ncbi:MAG: hypothetical protein JEZ00_03330 [Anaerolineaceae bacterium]|nr:hypothetical protein [Anaerolineaceae bacterium]
MNRKIIILVVLLVMVSAACSQTDSVLKKSDTMELDTLSEAEIWSEPHIVTSKYKKGIEVSMSEGGIKFHVNGNDSYVYKFYERDTYENVTIEAEINNMGVNNNGIAFVCQANEDRTEWVEIRVSNQGRYDLYHFDEERRDEYQNPYEDLMRFGRTDAFHPVKNNLIKVTCDSNTYTLYVNDELVFESEAAVIEGQGGVGVGVLAYDELPVSIVFESIKVSKP